MGQLEFRVGSATEIGGRARNEDRLLVGARLIAVADGMGGHDDGDIASQIAVEELDRLCGMPSLEAYDVIASIQRANDRITLASRDLAGRARMGTTVTGAALVEQAGQLELLVFNIGDSRTYLLRDDLLEQLTADDSLVSELIAAGELPEAERTTDGRRHIVTRILGSQGGASPSIRSMTPRLGDRVLSCSDGISDVLALEAISGRVRSTTPAEAAEALCRDALAAHGTDNMTVVIAEIVADRPLAAADEDDTVRSGLLASPQRPLDALEVTQP